MRLFILLFALGAGWVQLQPELPPTGWPWLAAPLAGGLLLAWGPRRRAPALLRWIALAVAGAACGIGWAAWMAGVRLADALPAEWEGRDVRVMGVIASLPQPYERSLRFELDVERVGSPEARVPARIAVSWWGSPARDGRPATFPELRAGERWELTVRLRRPHGALNPHGFDYEAWLLERGIRAVGYVRPGAGNRRLDAFVWRPGYAVERAREAIRARIQRALEGKPHAGILAALAIGDQRAIPPSQWQTFTRTGVNHLMSISGLHVTMFGGLAFAGALWLWRRAPRLALRWPAQKAAALAGLAAAFAYAALAGFAVPAQRTVYMLAVAAVAVIMGWPVAASTLLAAALGVVLLVDPWAVLAPGFWLSFGAVAIILYVTAGRIAVPGRVAGWVRVQWAITLGLTPLLIALFQQVSLVSPLANALAIPAVSLVVVPITLAALAVPFDAVLHLAHFAMALVMAPLEWLAALPAAVWEQHAPAPWAVAVALTGIAWMLAPRGVPARWAGAALVVPLFAVAPAPVAPGRAEVTVLDVGQGTAVLVRTARGALLYDAGPAFGPEADSGNRIIVPYLRALGVTRLDEFIVSHDDKDHWGGALSVLAAVPVARFSSSLPAEHPVLAAASSASRCMAGERWERDGVRFTLLHPTEEDYLRVRGRDNDRTCVLRVEAGSTRLLVAGDIEQRSERALLARGAADLAADVLIVPHHGSRTSSTEAFVAASRARHAVFTVGYRNRFGHPKEDVVARYRDSGSRIYRSDRDGALLIGMAADGGLSLRPWRGEYRRYWHAARPSFGPLDDGEPAVEAAEEEVSASDSPRDGAGTRRGGR